jgi:DNA invertase Pin-like site-specific DNA recombinase
MTMTNGSNGSGSQGLRLTGTGASYVRISGDKQEVQRQYSDLADFERRHDVSVPTQHRYEDHMPRDQADKRPDFQRMLRAAKAGTLQWVWIQRIDRFGVEDGDELVTLRRELRKAGCRLIDNSGTDWTSRNLATLIQAGLAGEQSRGEQVEKSFRSLNGMVNRAKSGEWMGGPPKLGFDVGCFDRATGEELWRIVFVDRDVVGKEMRRGKQRPVYSIRRLKVYPDGRTERHDGDVVFRTSKETQVLRIVPTRDEAKLAAVRGIFTRYATEAVTFFDLAKWLNGLGIRNSFGKLFQSRDIPKMLTDEAYLGHPTFSKRRNGRFHRHDAKGGITEIEPELRGKDTRSDPADVIRSGRAMFEPIVDRPTWDAVQRKLRGREQSPRSVPKNPEMYLSGLVICTGCGKPMVARADRMEYYCGTWDKHRVRGTLADSPCLRNGVRQEVLEQFINRHLDETGRRLEMLTQAPDVDAGLTGKLERQEDRHWWEFALGLERLQGYLRKNHPQEYRELMADCWDHGEDEPREGFVEACIEYWRANFDPDKLEGEIERLDAKHTAVMQQWADLPTPLAKEKARTQLADLEARIEALRRQQEDLGDVVATHYDQMNTLRTAIDDAERAMQGEADARAKRQRAEALRAVLCRIECEFALTGKRGTSGPGQAGSRLLGVEFVPAGDGGRAEADVGQRSHGKP